MQIIAKLIPLKMKQRMKSKLLQALSAEPEIVSRIATRVIKTGLVNYLEWDYPAEKLRVLRYLEQRRQGEFEYTFSESSTKPTLYASIYACMIKGLHGELPAMPEKARKGWLDYLDSFQCKSDGFFRDPALAGEAYETGGAWGPGWGMRHLVPHAIIAYARLGRTPSYSFRFLEPYYDEKFLSDWLGNFAFSTKVWFLSVHIMNLYTVLQYARDYMHETRATMAINQIHCWLTARQTAETGMWHSYEVKGYPLLGDAIRGAYHFYPLFAYDRRPVAYREKIIDTILRSQNTWGGFEQDKHPSGTCEDIDALEPLIRFVAQTGYRQHEADLAVKRALVWVLANRHADGGYESLMENGCHYGNHPQTDSKPRESNLFATWFRTLTIAYLTNYLRMDNGYTLGRFPGYEVSLESPFSNTLS